MIWHRRVWLAGGVAIFGAWLLTFRLCDNLGLTIGPVNPMKNWGFLIQMALLTGGGLHLLLLVAVEFWRRRDLISLTLVFWSLSVMFCATMLNWTVNARGFLPLVPAMAILLVRRLDTIPQSQALGRCVIFPLVATAAISLCLVTANYQWANSTRTAADIAAKYKPAGHQLWFEGHGGLQYYLEKAGGQHH